MIKISKGKISIAKKQNYLFAQFSQKARKDTKPQDYHRFKQDISHRRTQNNKETSPPSP